MTSSQLILYAALINGAIGFALGLIPLLFGYFNSRLRTGVFGIIAATVGGMILGIFLSVPATVFFTWLAVRKAKPESPTSAGDADADDH